MEPVSSTSPAGSSSPSSDEPAVRGPSPSASDPMTTPTVASDIILGVIGLIALLGLVGTVIGFWSMGRAGYRKD